LIGLVADSFDMLVDASVYGQRLWAIGSTVTRMKSVARFNDIIQFILAGLDVFVLIRQFILVDEVPNFRMMIIVSFLSLIANTICLYLLQRSKSGSTFESQHDFHIK